MTDLNATNVETTIRDTWHQLTGNELGDIAAHLAQRIAATYSNDNYVNELRNTITFNRQQHIDELEHLNRQRLGDALALVRIIDGNDTEADQVRLRWIRMTLAAKSKAEA